MPQSQKRPKNTKKNSQERDLIDKLLFELHDNGFIALCIFSVLLPSTVSVMVKYMPVLQQTIPQFIKSAIKAAPAPTLLVAAVAINIACFLLSFAIAHAGKKAYKKIDEKRAEGKTELSKPQQLQKFLRELLPNLSWIQENVKGAELTFILKIPDTFKISRETLSNMDIKKLSAKYPALKGDLIKFKNKLLEEAPQSELKETFSFSLSADEKNQELFGFILTRLRHDHIFNNSTIAACFVDGSKQMQIVFSPEFDPSIKNIKPSKLGKLKNDIDLWVIINSNEFLRYQQQLRAAPVENAEKDTDSYVPTTVNTQSSPENSASTAITSEITTVPSKHPAVVPETITAACEQPTVVSEETTIALEQASRTSEQVSCQPQSPLLVEESEKTKLIAAIENKRLLILGYLASVKYMQESHFADLSRKYLSTLQTLVEEDVPTVNKFYACYTALIRQSAKIEKDISQLSSLPARKLRSLSKLFIEQTYSVTTELFEETLRVAEQCKGIPERAHAKEKEEADAAKEAERNAKTLAMEGEGIVVVVSAPIPSSPSAIAPAAAVFRPAPVSPPSVSSRSFSSLTTCPGGKLSKQDSQGSANSTSSFESDTDGDIDSILHLTLSPESFIEETTPEQAEDRPSYKMQIQHLL